MKLYPTSDEFSSDHQVQVYALNSVTLAFLVGGLIHWLASPPWYVMPFIAFLFTPAVCRFAANAAKKVK
jgi:hypothetical protein